MGFRKRGTILKPGSHTSRVYGDIINDSFAPQLGTYSAHGTAAFSISSGNMQINGGTSAVANYIQCDDYTFDVENINFSMTYRMTSTAAGQIGPLIIKKSTNPTLQYQIYFGIYFCPNPNKAVLQVFGSTINTLYVGSEFDITTSSNLTIEGNFIESQFVIKAYVNGVQADSYTINYDIFNNPLTGEGKPNENVYRIIEPSSIINVSNITISSQAYKFATVALCGDSNTAGYFVLNQAARHIQILRDSYSRIVTVFSGSGDNTASINRCKQSIAIFRPRKLVLAIGTNDYVTSPALWQTNYAALVTYFESLNIQVIVCSLLPQNANDVSGSKTWIDSTYTGTNQILDLFTIFKGAGTGFNPVYSNDGLHINTTGAIVYANQVNALL